MQNLAVVIHSNNGKGHGNWNGTWFSTGPRQVIRSLRYIRVYRGMEKKMEATGPCRL